MDTELCLIPTASEISKKDIRGIIRDLEKFFLEADEDGGGGLDVDEFSMAMKNMYSEYTEEELIALHMQIDANCDGTVDFQELLDFELGKYIAKEKLGLRLFPLPMKNINVGYYNKIVKIIDRPIGTHEDDGRDVRHYTDTEYLSITCDGLVNFWTKRFDEKIIGCLYMQSEPLPYSHEHRVHIRDMVYIKERKEVAIATSDRELCFYNWSNSKLHINHSIILEGGQITTLDYWSNGTKAVFSFGDTKGFIYIFISNDIKEHHLFDDSVFEKPRLKRYDRVYVSTLLKNASKDHIVARYEIFYEPCTSVKYFPYAQEFGICGVSATELVLAAIPKRPKEKLVKRVFKSPPGKRMFKCVEYCEETRELVTGGYDGVLRTWLSDSTHHRYEMQGPNKPVNFLLHNPKEKILIALYEDQTIYIWSVEDRECNEHMKIEGLGQTRISAVTHIVQNNEIVIANTNIGVYLGKGTDLFKKKLSSHPMPLCGAIYHQIFKQVVSVCQKGQLNVWDVNSGKTLMQFNVSPFKLVAHTAVALDKHQRQLITVCNDGFVRFWNFNNGRELNVLPVTVPTVVTGIICTDERVFISGKNSNILYNLDLNGKDHTYIEHPLMKGGISSIKTCNGVLITACGNGCVIFWNMESLESDMYIDPKVSPDNQWVTKKEYRGKVGNLPENGKAFPMSQSDRVVIPDKLAEAKTKVIEQSEVFNSPLIVNLHAEPDDYMPLVIAQGSSISLWSIPFPGLLSKFIATCDKDATITCLEADANGNMLMAGDSNGYVYIWDMVTYRSSQYASEGPFEKIGSRKVSVRPPPILGTWKAHHGPVMSFSCTPHCENYVTTGWDCNVQLWTKTQRSVGIFEKDEWESSHLSSDWQPPLEPVETPKEDVSKEGVDQVTAEEPIAEERLKLIGSLKQELFETQVHLEWTLEHMSMSRSMTDLSVYRPQSQAPPEEVAARCKKTESKRKIRHFLERKQAADMQCLYKVTGPLQVPQEQLLNATKCEDMQIQITKASFVTRNDKKRYSAARGDRSKKMEEKSENELIVESKKIPNTDLLSPEAQLHYEKLRTTYRSDKDSAHSSRSLAKLREIYKASEKYGTPEPTTEQSLPSAEEKLDNNKTINVPDASSHKEEFCPRAETKLEPLPSETKVISDKEIKVTGQLNVGQETEVQIKPIWVRCKGMKVLPPDSPLDKKKLKAPCKELNIINVKFPSKPHPPTRKTISPPKKPVTFSGSSNKKVLSMGEPDSYFRDRAQNQSKSSSQRMEIRTFKPHPPTTPRTSSTMRPNQRVSCVNVNFTTAEPQTRYLVQSASKDVKIKSTSQPRENIREFLKKSYRVEPSPYETEQKMPAFIYECLKPYLPAKTKVQQPKMWVPSRTSTLHGRKFEDKFKCPNQGVNCVSYMSATRSISAPLTIKQYGIPRVSSFKPHPPTTPRTTGKK